MVRPRRSAVPATYQIDFPSLGSSEDEDGGTNSAFGAEQSAGAVLGDKEGDNDKNGVDSDEEDIDDSASGSEYAPEVIKGTDGQELQGADESDASVDMDDVVEEDEDGDSAAGEANLDDNISIAASENLPLHERLLSPGAPGAYSSKNKGKGRAIASLPFPILSSGPVRTIVGRGPPAATSGINKKSVARWRPAPASKGINSKISALYDLSYGPSFYPAPRMTLTKDFDDEAHTLQTDNTENVAGRSQAKGIALLDPLDPVPRVFAIKRASYLPFGPHWSACEDFGWYKGKMVQEDSSIGEGYQRSKRWGGWYDSVETIPSQFELVQDLENIFPYLPRNVYPARPSPIHLVYQDGQDDKVEDNEDDLWNDSTNNSIGQSFVIPDVTELQWPHSNAAEAFSGPLALLPDLRSASSRVTGAGREDDGVFRMQMGLSGNISIKSEKNGSAADPATQHAVEIERFTAQRLDAHVPRKPGHILNVGGPVLGLDWCPQADDDSPTACEFLAVSTVSDQQAITYKRSNDGPTMLRHGMVQIWSLDTSVASDLAASTDDTRKGHGMRFELALLLEREILSLQWCPKGGSSSASKQGDEHMHINGEERAIESLGILATLTVDGQLALYAVPRPDAMRSSTGIADDDLIFLRPKKPLLQLSVGTIPLSAFDWGNHEMLVAGSTTGHIAVFEVGEAMRLGQSKIEPSHFFAAHESSILMLSVVREPPLNADGSDRVDANPTKIATASVDGTTRLVDLLDWGSELNPGHDRAVRATSRYQPSTGGILYSDPEHGLRCLTLKMRDLGASLRVIAHRGSVRDIAASDHHTFAATGSADGYCTVANVLRRLKRSGHAVHYSNPVYRIDFNRKTGQYRMLDNLLPDVCVSYLRWSSTDAAAYLQSRVTADASRRGRSKKKGKQGQLAEEEGSPDPETLVSMAWPPEVAVNKVAWHRSLRRAHVLASGMACGLVRVDVTSRTWPLDASENVKMGRMDGDDEEE